MKSYAMHDVWVSALPLADLVLYYDRTCLHAKIECFL